MTVLYITSLLNSGNGTLRDCITRADALGGNCSIVPLVAGDTILSSMVTLAGAANVTLAGIPGWRVVGHEVKFTNCQNVKVFNVANYGSSANRNTQNFTFEDCAGVLLSHCAGFWATDDPFGFDGCTDVTVQDCLIAECLQDTFGVNDPLSKGGIVTGGSDRVTWLRTLFVHCGSRVPLLSSMDNGGARLHADVIDCVAYNRRNGWLELHPHGGPVSVNVIGYTDIAGPDTFSGTRQHTVALLDNMPDTQYLADSAWHVADCLSPSLPVAIEVPDGADGITPNGDWPAMSESALALSGVVSRGRAAAYAYVLAHAGTLVRDSHQQRVVADAVNGTGTIIDDPSEVGG